MNLNIEFEETDSEGRVVARSAGKLAGTMTYSKAGKARLIVDHTEVEEDFRGTDVGLQMLRALVEMVRKEKLRVIPLCPFANAMFRRHKDLQDVL